MPYYTASKVTGPTEQAFPPPAIPPVVALLVLVIKK